MDIEAAVRAVSPSSTVGCVVFDRARASTIAAINARRQFRAASIVKLLIAIDALRGGTVDGTRVRSMLVHSDDRIASELWVDGGGDDIIARTSALLGLEATEAPDLRGRWGNVLLNARDVVTIYRYIRTAAPRASRELIVPALSETARLAADGWYQHFGIPDGIGKPWAIKQGWSSSTDNLVVHTTGLVGQRYRYIVVLLLEADLRTEWETLRRACTAAATETASLLARG